MTITRFWLPLITTACLCTPVLAVAPVPEADSVLHSNDAERPILLDKCNVTDRDGV